MLPKGGRSVGVCSWSWHGCAFLLPRLLKQFVQLLLPRCLRQAQRALLSLVSVHCTYDRI